MKDKIDLRTILDDIKRADEIAEKQRLVTEALKQQREAEEIINKEEENN